MSDNAFLQSLHPVLVQRHGAVYYDPDHHAVLLQAQRTYLPYEHFLHFLQTIEQLADRQPVVVMVFDKSSLKIFHQPSMEWYHVVWKENMYRKGLRTYRKVLPADPLFKESVRIGRERIERENPGFQLSKFDIRYASSLQEAWAEVTARTPNGSNPM
ncbi:MAG: hypothetical protein ICV83_10650 [Cytophagales bacterium]|nr:hypothetical protein [Cytophagales bacterium]